MDVTSIVKAIAAGGGGAGGGGGGGNFFSGLGQGLSQAGGGLLQQTPEYMFGNIHNPNPSDWMNPGINHSMMSNLYGGAFTNQNQMPFEDEEEDRSFDFGGFGNSLSQIGNSLMRNY